jgi:virulence-associated protein VagC
MKGQSQAVCIPEAFRFDTDEVYITKRGEELFISVIEPTWDEFFDSKSVFDDNFLKDRFDTEPQGRDFD